MRAMRPISLGVVLFAFWLALSGHLTALLLGVGLASAVLCAYAAARMRIVDAEGHPIEWVGGFLVYLPWLVAEIAKSAWTVARIVLDPKLPVSPAMTVVKSRAAYQRRHRHLRQFDHADARHHHRRCERQRFDGALPGPRRSRRPRRRRDGPACGGAGKESRLMFHAAAAAILAALVLALIRAVRGPSVFDRVLAGNSVGLFAILLLAVVGFLTGRPAFLDIALTYGLLNLIGTLAVLKFFRHGDLAYDVDEDGKS